MSDAYDKQTPALRSDDVLVFDSTFENMQAMLIAETSHTQTSNIHKQTPALRSDDVLVFDSTFENMQAMLIAETSHTQTSNIHKPDETGEPGGSGYSITTKHGPRKQVLTQIHQIEDEEELCPTETELFKYSYTPKTTIVYVSYGQTIRKIKNKNPHLTCADVDRSDINYFDNINAPNKLFQCADCEKFFSRISAYRKHLVEVVLYVCNSCGKKFKYHWKYLLHCHGHGNPERECSGCRKVLANRYTLKKHMSICKKMLTLKLRGFRKSPTTANN